MDRRTVLKAGLVLAGTSHTAVATAEIAGKIHDPILAAIQEFHDGCARFNALPGDAITRENEDELIAATYGAPEARLVDWNQPAHTREGAIAALKFMKEQDVFIDAMGEGMRKAVLGYLEGLA